MTANLSSWLTSFLSRSISKYQPFFALREGSIPISIGSVVATLINSVLLMISSASVATFVAHANVSPADELTSKGTIGTAAASSGSGFCA